MTVNAGTLPSQAAVVQRAVLVTGASSGIVELARIGVRVSLIEPGNYGTEIGKNMLARMVARARPPR